jgi:hypothetical protein
MSYNSRGKNVFFLTRFWGPTDVTVVQIELSGMHMAVGFVG